MGLKQPQIEVPRFVRDEESRAYELMDAGKYLEAKDILQPLAKQDSIYALRSLGWIYHLGKLDSVDLTKASSCYGRIAELG